LSVRKVEKIMKVFFVISILLFINFRFNNDLKDTSIPTGNVIFIHPDGSGPAMWEACRILQVGPDGMLNWDRMDNLGLYRGHLTNSTNSSSHGGATVHSYGVKVPFNTYGFQTDRPFTSLSGKKYSIMTEAKKAGKAIALINSGHVCEPGTGVFVASHNDREDTDPISKQIIESGADILLAGGEVLLLPEGMVGRHGKAGIRKDGRNLISYAQEMGYKVVYTKEELEALPIDTKKVLGVFAAGHTFNDYPEEVLQRKGLPLYLETAPTVAEMAEKALKILKAKGVNFLMVVEEEGSDNFANANNAQGALEAIRRADQAIGVAMNYIDGNPNTLLITAADSDAGGMKIVNVRHPDEFERNLPATMKNGAPLDGRDGAHSLPFITAPDNNGNRLHFGICWTSYEDVGGGIVAKAHGLNAHFLPKNVDNTDIYRMMYATLFGKWLP
jgi:alkaline phosphatase